MDVFVDLQLGSRMILTFQTLKKVQILASDFDSQERGMIWRIPEHGARSKITRSYPNVQKGPGSDHNPFVFSDWRNYKQMALYD